MRDPEFHDLQKKLDSYFRKVHQEGDSKSTKTITREDEEKLWQLRVLNPDEKMIHTMIPQLTSIPC